MKKLIYTATFLAVFGISQAQEVTSFAGQENSDPYSNFDNTTADAANAYFFDPEGLAFDPNGNLYITERNKVRLMIGDKVYNRSGYVGNPSFSQGFADGANTAARYYAPTGIVCASNGEAYVVDSENHAIRKLSAFTSIGVVQQASTFAGAKTTGQVGGVGTPGDANGNGTNARFNIPKGIAMDATGTMYVTDWYNSIVRKVDASGNVTTIAGNSGVQGSKDGQGTGAEFNSPYGVVVLDNQNILVTDQVNCNIRKINTVNGTVTTLTGKSGTSRHKDGTLAEATFIQPKGIAILDGLIYVCDYTSIRVIDLSAGTVSTLAGNPAVQGNVNGNGSSARFGHLAGITVLDDALYVTDVEYHVIKKVTIDNLTPRANFSASKQNLLINEQTVLTDESAGKLPLTYQWSILRSGGAGNYTLISGDETSESLTLSFPTTGFYDVELTVSNDYGQSTLKKEGFFSVSTTGSVAENESNHIKLWPVPAGESIYLEMDFPLSGAVQIEVYDLQGRLVDQNSFDMMPQSLEIQSLKSGQYFLVIKADNFRGYRKFSKI